MNMKLQTLIDTKKLLVMPETEYHSASGFFVNPARRQGMYLSSHLLAALRKSPKRFLRLATKKEAFLSCYAFRFGSAAHGLILEGVANVDGVSAEDVAMLSQMNKAVKENPVVHKILAKGKAELVARASVCGYECQVRIDWLTESNLIVNDLKTTKSINTFVEDVIRYEYIEQLAFYEMVLCHALDIRRFRSACLIAVEKTRDNPRCTTYAIDEDWMMWARRRQAITIAALDQCAKRNEFPKTFPAEFSQSMPEPPKRPPLIWIG